MQTRGLGSSELNHAPRRLLYSIRKLICRRQLMRVSYWLGACAALLIFAAPAAKAQDKPATEPPAPEAIEQPAKLQIVLTEYDGTKKISSMPTRFLSYCPVQP